MKQSLIAVVLFLGVLLGFGGGFMAGAVLTDNEELAFVCTSGELMREDGTCTSEQELFDQYSGNLDALLPVLVPEFLCRDYTYDDVVMEDLSAGSDHIYRYTVFCR